MKIENAEIRRPNREAIAAYKASLGAKSGKSKEEDTESSEEEPELDNDEEKLDFDVLDIEDDNDKDDADLDTKVDEEDAKASGNEIDSDEDEDEVSEEIIEPVNTISILLPLHLIIWYIDLGLQKVEQISQCQSFCIDVAWSASISPRENSEEDPLCTISILFG